MRCMTFGIYSVTVDGRDIDKEQFRHIVPEMLVFQGMIKNMAAETFLMGKMFWLRKYLVCFIPYQVWICSV